MSNRRHELIKGHRSEVTHGYEERLAKYYIAIIDSETNSDTRIYLDKDDFELFAHTMLNSLKDKENVVTQQSKKRESEGVNKEERED